MAILVNPTPILPRAITAAPNVQSLAKYDAALNQALFQALIQIAFRLNLAITSDGETPLAAPIVLKSYTVAGVPDAANWQGAIIYVSDEAGGKTIAFSDGTDWRRVQDRAIIS